MTPRPSARTREQAILICDVAANNKWAAPYSHQAIAQMMRRDFGVPASRTAMNLAYEAWFAVKHDAACRGLKQQQVDAEAAAMLADGWCIGDLLEMLP